MTVFVVHGQSGGQHDLTPAAKFGELRYVNQYYIHGDELIIDQPLYLTVGAPGWTIPPGYRLNMERAAADFDPDTDYLLIYGDHLQLLAFTMILTAKFHHISVLRYDRRMNDYIPVRLHSGLVPPGRAVVASGTDIGETEHVQDRKREVHPICEYCESRHDPRVACPEYAAHRRGVTIESPLARRNPFKSS